MNENGKTLEQISALSDGELAHAQVAMTLAALRRPEEQAAWDAYHHIGDVMRSDEMAIALSPDFLTRLSARLDAEPAIALPDIHVSRTQSQPTPRGRNLVMHVMHRFTKSRLAAGVVIVMTTAAVLSLSPLGTKSKEGVSSPGSAARVASVRANPYSTVDNSYALKISDVRSIQKEVADLQQARDESYLMAHQRFSSPLLGTVQYARMASFATDSDK